MVETTDNQRERELIDSSPFDNDIHHLTPYPTNPDHLAKLLEFRSILQNSGSDLYMQNLKWCTDLQLVRFLIARKYVIKDAYDLMVTAFTWRSSRPTNDVEQTDGWADKMGNEASTGECVLSLLYKEDEQSKRFVDFREIEEVWNDKIN